jgi:hypothetical protein
VVETVPEDRAVVVRGTEGWPVDAGAVVVGDEDAVAADVADRAPVVPPPEEQEANRTADVTVAAAAARVAEALIPAPLIPAHSSRARALIPAPSSRCRRRPARQVGVR